MFHWNICVAWHCKGNPDADDDDDDDAAAYESNPYMSPFQAIQEGIIFYHWEVKLLLM